MSLYAVPAYAGQPDAAMRLIREHPFATLITWHADEEPLISHVPLLLEETGSQAALLGHLARANPQWRSFGAGRTRALFHGPHAYVSPAWYAEPADHVPTWLYTVVHVRGRIELLDAEQTRATVQAMTRYFDPQLTVAVRSTRFEQLLKGIVGFRLVIEGMEAKLKLNQNKSAADRSGVIAGLEATGQDAAAATAAWMAANASG